MAKLVDLAARLHAARAAATVLQEPLDDVTSVEQAYRVQQELVRLAGGMVGWKVTAVLPEAQARFGANRPLGGMLVANHAHRALCDLSAATFVAPLIECEIAFLLGSDLPARAEPYSRAEVERAVEAAVPAFEFADGRIPAQAPDIHKLADAMNSGCFVSGEPVADWRGLDLAALGIELFQDGRSVARGAGSAVPGGDPLGSLVALANAHPLPGRLQAGQIVTTGTCTPPLPVGPGRYRATFGALGSLEIRVTD